MSWRFRRFERFQTSWRGRASGSPGARNTSRVLVTFDAPPNVSIQGPIASMEWLVTSDF